MIETYGVKYIGSKNKIIPHIVNACEEISEKRTLIDAFTGTTRVAQAMKKRGFAIQTADLNWASEAYSYTFICNEGSNQHLQEIVDHLNNVEPEKGWITENYCDVESDGTVVRVWQPKNGMKADSIRNKIEEMDLSRVDKCTLITALIFALDRVDNTVGVQQAYLKKWCKRSYNDLYLILPKVCPFPKGKHYTGDVLSIDFDEAEIAYLDPPYSSHSYSTYYHIWDSIYKWDKPKVGLKTNRRIDRIHNSKDFDFDMKSTWNSKKTALKSFKKLVDRLPVRYIMISYNNEGIISSSDFLDFVNDYEDISIKEIDYKRNIMSQIGNAKLYKTEYNTKNKEYLVTFRKG